MHLTLEFFVSLQMLGWISGQHYEEYFFLNDIFFLRFLLKNISFEVFCILSDVGGAVNTGRTKCSGGYPGQTQRYW